jgi:hypothetical protein
MLTGYCGAGTSYAIKGSPNERLLLEDIYYALGRSIYHRPVSVIIDWLFFLVFRWDQRHGEWTTRLFFGWKTLLCLNERG